LANKYTLDDLFAVLNRLHNLNAGVGAINDVAAEPTRPGSLSARLRWACERLAALSDILERLGAQDAAPAGPDEAGSVSARLRWLCANLPSGGGGAPAPMPVVFHNGATSPADGQEIAVPAGYTELLLEIWGDCARRRILFRGKGPSGIARPIAGLRLADMEVAAESILALISDIDRSQAYGTGSLAATGTPAGAYDVIIEFSTPGGLGEAGFYYSLDGGISWPGDEITVPDDGVWEFPATGLTLTFLEGNPPQNSFLEGDIYRFTTILPDDTNELWRLPVAGLAAVVCPLVVIEGGGVSVKGVLV